MLLIKASWAQGRLLEWQTHAQHHVPLKSIWPLNDTHTDKSVLHACSFSAASSVHKYTPTHTRNACECSAVGTWPLCSDKHIRRFVLLHWWGHSVDCSHAWSWIYSPFEKIMGSLCFKLSACQIVEQCLESLSFNTSSVLEFRTNHTKHTSSYSLHFSCIKQPSTIIWMPLCTAVW